MPHRRSALLPALFVLALASLLLGLSSGSLSLSPARIWATLSGTGSPLERELILGLRLPRVLAAFAVGGLLALAGALMQVLLRNPLGDPYVLGVSGGAAGGALGAMLLGLSAFWLQTSAFAGALLSMLLVFALARGRGVWSPSRLLLTGVVVAAGWGALISFLLAVTPGARLPGMLFWLMGDLSDARQPALPLTALGLGLVLAWVLARPLDLLARGELQAAALGVEVAPLRQGVFLLASLLTALAVTSAGSIGFVGLVVPHLLRLAGAREHRRLLPGAVLAGGALLVLADGLARSLLAPQQLPVGVITALLGVPLFLYLLNRRYAELA
jgi:iron complex transport system permease protein